MSLLNLSPQRQPVRSQRYLRRTVSLRSGRRFVRQQRVVSRRRHCRFDRGARDRHVSHCGAMVAAGHVGIQRLGQQLLSVICRAHDRYSGFAIRGCFRMGTRRSQRRGNFESRHRVLGDLQLQPNRSRASATGHMPCSNHRRCFSLQRRSPTQ